MELNGFIDVLVRVFVFLLRAKDSHIEGSTLNIDLSENSHQSSFVIAACIALKEICFGHVSIYGFTKSIFKLQHTKFVRHDRS
jgi:hypothetical protein